MQVKRSLIVFNSIQSNPSLIVCHSLNLILHTELDQSPIRSSRLKFSAQWFHGGGPISPPSKACWKQNSSEPYPPTRTLYFNVLLLNSDI